MATPKEIFLETLKADGKPERQLVQYEALAVQIPDPVFLYVGNGSRPGATVKNQWGVTILFPEGDPGPTPLITPETKVCPDITRWREFVHAPDIEAACVEGWEPFIGMGRAVAGNDKLLTAFWPTGLFEQCHFLMGFEDTLANFYEHPDEMHELIDYITEYRLKYAKLLIDKLQPDAILSHDDWGAKKSLFMSPEMWREFFKEPYRKIYQYIRSRGVIAIHHADSYLAPIVEDMAEIGVQVWQGVLPENDIPALQKRLNGSMVLMGGIGAAIDRPDSTEEEIRAYVREALETYCPGGHYIPSITYGGPGTVFPHVDPIINEEIEAYNKRLTLPVTPSVSIPRRRAAAAKATAAAEIPSETNEVLAKIAAALCKGQKKKVLAGCEEALSAGFSAQTILTDGLVAGMTQLGDDFTAGRAFVPEMLMAARCMNAATEQLKPLLVGEATAPTGRVCLGTVKGDMHDIGKNLVKIMMEGCGLEVIDLGVDVSPETFVATAKEKQCNIIACSSLLTTCMMEMKNVVALAESEGIRDQVKILVGGAPITQEFCDEIGADAYTGDAAQAARVAVSLLNA